LDSAFNSVEPAQQTATEFLKKRKNTAKANVSSVEQNNEIRVIRGTCPIDLEGHPQAENSKLLWTQKEKVESSDFALMWFFSRVSTSVFWFWKTKRFFPLCF
jgi:hypothetical protein